MSSKSTPVVEEEGMSFLDHLDELRRRVTYASIAVAIAFVFCFTYSEQIYSFLDKPVRKALDEAMKVSISRGEVPIRPIQALPDDVPFDYVFGASANVEGTNIPAGASISAKIKTIQGKRFIVTASKMVVNDKYFDEGFKLLPDEISSASNNSGDNNSAPVVHTLQSGFNLYIKVAFYAAIALAIPALLYQIWAFIAPGLYEHEKRGVVPFLIVATIFFIMGAAFGYYIAFPRAVKFLLGVSHNFRPMIEVNDYFDLIITIILGLGLVFEIPAIVYFLARLGLMTHKFMLKFWRHAIVVIMIIAAILSPTTDIPNMMVFAIPMAILYFLSVGVAWVFGRERSKEAY